MEINIQQIISDILNAGSNILKKDISSLRGFEMNQVRALAQHSKLIASGIVTGEINNELKNFFLEGLESMALNFVRTIKGLVEITIEKVWNAIVEVLFKAIEVAAGSIIK
jgi:hypothetical protein